MWKINRTSRIAAAFAGVLLLALPMAGAKHDDWFEVRSANFVVVSNGGEKRAINTAKVFEQIRVVFRESIAMVAKHPSPLITVIAVKNEDSMRELLPEYWTKGHVHPAGLFEHGMMQYEAAIQLDAQGDNPYETIYHEYYHSLTMPYFPNLPLWVAEGMADFFGNTRVEGNEAGIGYVDLGQLQELASERFIPLQTLFKVDHDSPYYNEQTKTGMFYAESWALVHYLMVGDNGSHKAAFSEYLKELGDGATQEDAGAKAFGNLDKLQMRLETYIHGNSFSISKFHVDAKISESDFKVRPISEGEASAYKGGFLTLRGRTQEALPVLEEAVKEAPTFALAYQNLGMAQFDAGQRDRALESVSKAIELDSKDGLVHFLRAYLSFQSGAQMTDNMEVESDLRAAIAASPEFAPAYSMLAMKLAAKPEDDNEALEMARKAISLEPGNGTFRLTLAHVLARMGKFDEAQTAALTARAEAKTAADKQQAENFLSYLEQAKNFREGGGNATAADANADADAGDVEEASGTVTKGSCEIGGPRIELKTDAGMLLLHAPLNGGIQILMKKRPAGGFNPCTSLTGTSVEVQYTPDEGQESAGTLKRITVVALAGEAGAADTKAEPQKQ